MDILDRAGGALLGMAIGEALGAPLEGLTHEQVLKRLGRLEGFVDPRRTQPPYRSGYFQLGVYEDETQIALAAAEVAIKNNGFSPDLFRDRLDELGQPVDGNAFGCFRRARRNFRVAVRRMQKGATWQTSGVNTAGSGAASRGIPIGVYYHSDRVQRTRKAIEAGLVTHKDPRGIAASVAMAHGTAVAMAAAPQGFDIEGFIRTLVAECREAEDVMAAEYGQYLQVGFEPFLHQISDGLKMLTELVTLDLEPAFAKIVGFAHGKGSRPITQATRGFSLTELLTTFYFFLTGLDSYEETVLDVVAEGGSSDSLGCLVGGLLGALHGARGIPDTWRAQLKNSDQVELRGRILGGAPREGLKSLLLLEAALTQPIPKVRPKQKGDAQRGGPRRGPQRGGGRGGPRGRPMRGGPRGAGGGRGAPRGGPGGRRPMGGRGGGPGRGPGGGGMRGGPGGRPGGRPGYGGGPRPPGRSGYGGGPGPTRPPSGDWPPAPGGGPGASPDRPRPRRSSPEAPE